MKPEPIRYQTELPVSVCIARLVAEPWVFGDELDPLWFRCDASSDCWLLVTFRGGRFRKMRSTQYLITFSRQENRTIAAVEFQHEMWNLPSMTPVAEIDLLMQQKIHAIRIG